MQYSVRLKLITGPVQLHRNCQLREEGNFNWITLLSTLKLIVWTYTSTYHDFYPLWQQNKIIKKGYDEV